jgi:hypothetical protein
MQQWVLDGSTALKAAAELHDLVWNDETTLNEYSSNADAGLETPPLIRGIWTECAESNEEICFPGYDAASLCNWILILYQKCWGPITYWHVISQNRINSTSAKTSKLGSYKYNFHELWMQLGGTHNANQPQCHYSIQACQVRVIGTLHKISLWPRIFICSSWDNFMLRCNKKISEKQKCSKWQIFHDIAPTNSAQSVWQFIPFHKCDKVPYLQLFLQLKKDFIMQKHLSTVHWSSCLEI